MTPSMVRGMRGMSVIRDNPEWWALEVFDGFGVHITSVMANELRYEAKILSLKEEGDSSSVNQAYDKFVAKVCYLLLLIVMYYSMLSKYMYIVLLHFIYSLLSERQQEPTHGT